MAIHTGFRSLAAFLFFSIYSAISLSSPTNAEEAVTLKPVTDPKANSPREDLRTKLFQSTLSSPSCIVLSTDPRGKMVAVDPELDQFVKQVISNLKAKDEKALKPLFHKRLGIKANAIAQTLAKLDSTYGPGFDVSSYRIWALNTVDGSPKGLACENAQLTVYPQYGYPLQIVLWLQIQGSLELGRLFISVVPADGHWNIGAFNVEQWTHASKDFSMWATDAQKAAANGQKEAAYVFYDIAAKLLDGGGHLDFPAEADIAKAKDAVMTTNDWEKSIRSTLKSWDVAYMASVLVIDGAGILVRLRMAQEISVDNMKSECTKVAAELKKAPWRAELKGVRCSFLLPKESASKDGGMGGIYVDFADADKK